MFYPIVRRGGLSFSVVPLSVVRRWSGPGIYLLELGARRSKVLYVGQSSDLGARLGPGHKALEAATARGMTTVSVHFGPDDDAERSRLANRLRGRYDPPLNEQGGPTADAFAAGRPGTTPHSSAFGGQPKGPDIGLLAAVAGTPGRQ